LQLGRPACGWFRAWSDTRCFRGPYAAALSIAPTNAASGCAPTSSKVSFITIVGTPRTRSAPQDPTAMPRPPSKARVSSPTGVGAAPLTWAHPGAGGATPRRLRVAEAHAGDLPAVADAGRARIPGHVRQSRHPRVPQPTLISQHTGDCAGTGGIFPARAESVRPGMWQWARFGRSGCGAVGPSVAGVVPGRPEPFQARLAPTCRNTRGPAND